MSNFYPTDYPGGADSVITLQVRRRPMKLGDKPLIVLKTPGRVPPGARGERLRAASLAVARRSPRCHAGASSWRSHPATMSSSSIRRR